MGHIADQIQAAHQNAINKGWWVEDRTFGEIIALIQSEVAEALEDFRIPGNTPNKKWYEKKYTDETVVMDVQCDETWKPCGIPSELADIIIRIYDACGRYGWADLFEEIFVQMQNLEIQNPDVGVSSRFPFAHNLTIINGWLIDSFRSQKPWDIVYYLALAAADTRLLAEKHMIDLDRAITEKMAYNATRMQRHGGKVI